MINANRIANLQLRSYVFPLRRAVMVFHALLQMYLKIKRLRTRARAYINNKKQILERYAILRLR